MNRKRTIGVSARLCLALAFVLALGAGALAATAPKVKAIHPPKAVLVVGNSFSFFNNGVHRCLLTLLKEADPAEGGGYSTKLAAISGAPLAEHRFGFEGLVQSRKWDAVILQGNSTEPIVPRTDADRQAFRRIQGNSAPKDHAAAAEAFKEYGRKYARIVRDTGAQPVFFMTWAFTGMPGMTQQLAEAYTSLANETDSLVAPVGLAFARSLEKRPDLALIIADERHPTKAGTYLAACTLYAALYGKSPEGIAFDGGLGQDARFLQGVAWETVKAFYGR